MKKGIIAVAGVLAGVGYAIFAYQRTKRISRQAEARRRSAGPQPQRPELAAAIDINHCDFQQILALPAIDSTLATRIIENRPYRTKFDLLERFIVPEDVFQQIRHDIRVQYAPAV